MADNVAITPGAGASIAADDIGGVLHQRVKVSVGADGAAADLAFGQALAAASLPVVIASNQSAVPVSGTVALDAGTLAALETITATGPLTDAQLRATAVPVSGTVTLDAGTLAALESITVSGTVTATGPLTDTQLRATAVPVSGTVTATGPLTDAQLRATAVPVSGTVTATGPLTDTQLRATAVPVSGTVALDSGTLAALETITVNGTVTATGPLTDTQLRATAVPVSGTVTATGPLTDAELRASPVPVSGSFSVSGSLTDDELRASPVAVSASALPLPTGAATQTTLAAIDDKTPALVTTVPLNSAAAPPVRQVGQDVWVCSFAAVGASLLSPDFITPVVGTGVGYSQAGGSLLITTGTSTNAEFFTRSTVSWRGSLRMRASLVASQRIAQNNLQITLADLIGSTLAFTIVSATLVDVTLTAHGFTAQNVGQFMNLAGITGAAGVPGRYAIASITDVNTIRFTVAGWPGSGSGTLTLFGWNSVRNLVTGTSATNINWDTQRRGWAAGDTVATINNTASPGTILQNDLNGRDALLADTLRATTGTLNVTARGSRIENLPDDDVPLYVFIWSYNGTSAPASTTTWTLGFISVEKFANQPVYIQGLRANGTQNALPAQITNTVSVSGTVTANIGTGAIAAGTNAIGDVGVQYRASATGAASFVAVQSPATPAATVCKAGAGRLLGVQLQNSAAAIRSVKFWNTAQGSVTLGTTAAVFEVDIPAGGRVDFQLPGGIGFATAITYAVTGAKGLTDNTGSLALNDVSGALFFA
jgi:hypothetical protein